MRVKPSRVRRPGLRSITREQKTGITNVEINILLTLDRREQAALQAALLTHGAPDCLVTMALTGACKISSLDEARQLRRWLVEARSGGDTDFASLIAIERELVKFGI